MITLGFVSYFLLENIHYEFMTLDFNFPFKVIQESLDTSDSLNPNYTKYPHLFRATGQIKYEISTALSTENDPKTRKDSN